MKKSQKKRWKPLVDKGFHFFQLSLKLLMSIEKIYASITFYLANKEELDLYLQRRRARDLEAYEEWATAPSATIKRLRIVREEQAKYQ